MKNPKEMMLLQMQEIPKETQVKTAKSYKGEVKKLRDIQLGVITLATLMIADLALCTPGIVKSLAITTGQLN
jgi:hypothetical protein